MESRGKKTNRVSSAKTRARKKSERDTSYRPTRSSATSGKRSLNQNTSSDLLAMRSNTAKQLDDQQPVKTSMLIESGIVTTQAGEAVMQENILSNLSGIPSYRPVGAIAAFSALGSPMQIETPLGKTALSRVAKYGPISIFANLPPVYPQYEPQSVLRNENAFYVSPQYQAIKRALEVVKFQQVIVTPSLLEESNKEHQKRGKRRALTQHQVMVGEGISERQGSATDYAAATQLFSDTVKWEWLHLVAHMILDKQSQQPENLVVGTAHANTNMLFIESEIAYLAKTYPDGFTLKVRASLIEGTQIAKQIEYQIETPDFTLPLVFDAQTPEQPHLSSREYIHLIVKALVEAHKNKVSPEPDSQLVSSAAVSFPFFQRPADAAAGQVDNNEKKTPTRRR